MDLIISYASSRLGGFFSCAALVASHASRSNPSDSDFLAGRKFSFTNAHASSNTAASVTSSLASTSFAVSAIARTRSTAGASLPPPTPTTPFASAFAAAACVATAAAAAHAAAAVPNARAVSTARRTNAADDDDDDETSSRPIPSVDASSSRLEHDARVDPGHRARCVRNDVRDDDARDDVARGDVAGGDRPIPRVHRMVRALARRGVRERTIVIRIRMLLRGGRRVASTIYLCERRSLHAKKPQSHDGLSRGPAGRGQQKKTRP